MRIKGYKPLIYSIAAAFALTALPACGLMHDDLPDCAVRPQVHSSVKFVYDHNTSLADRFASDVGSVTIYIFDEKGRYLTHTERSNTANDNALKDVDFCIDLPDDLKAGKYVVYAEARGCYGGYDADIKLPGAKYRRTPFDVNSTLADFRLKLDNTAGVVPHNNEMIDTLWTSLRACEFEIPEVIDPKEGDPQQPDVLIDVTIPLMRVTNHLHISFYQDDFKSSIDPDNYEIWATSASGRESMDLTGNFVDNSQALRFEPYNIYADGNPNGIHYVNADFGLTRFIYDPADTNRLMLHIRNKVSGNVTDIDPLPLLALGNQAFAEHHWSTQEYFDREYDYDLEFVCTDTSWKFATVKVNILSWAKRVQNTEL